MQYASFQVNAHCIKAKCISHRMSEMNERLAWARENAGYESASDAARALGIAIPTYVMHENGTRGFRKDSATRYAKFFRISLEWLLTGRGTATGSQTRTLPVVGYVGAGAEVFAIDDAYKGGGIDEIDAPPNASANAVAVRVRGESMLPVYRDGDSIIYDEQRSGADISQYIGMECVVRLADGRTFIKTVARGSDEEVWTLWSYNAPPMIDMIVEWAARVRWIERSR